MNEAPLILASASPRRAELLRQIGLQFQVCASVIQENMPAFSVTPETLVQDLALDKVKQVVDMVFQKAIIIGADTIVVMENRILGKPSGPEEAEQTLSLLSGKEHFVYTGLAIMEKPSHRYELSFAVTKVKFRFLSSRAIRSYVATGEPLDKAGSYGIQGKGALLVERIEGCYFNVVGLPISKLVSMLETFGVRVW